MQRIALGVEYDGRDFCGWQAQKEGVPTVQGAVEAALSTVANSPVRVICAGRTDTGVHGAEQVIHFDSLASRSNRAWTFGANANLPVSVCILWAKRVDNSFHARFSARRRRYQYVIFNRDVRPTYLAHRVTWEYRPLDIERMRAAASYLVGKHDFNAYRAIGCQAKSPVRDVYGLTVTRKDAFVFIDIEANGFLHHMVRNIAGVLMDIGAGKHEPVWAQEILRTQDRRLGGITAPPAGLYLERITYDEVYQLPQKLASDRVW
ncbi:MAG TPA: tRNA pseudouridine(38-40) synthase TruA [Gammaproteobacteria bacterium]|nr:tRNA pseudouridine(38-40) synthase TruA [Gammaproteobacteria bacterium]